MPQVELHTASFDDLSTRTLYAILRLRVDVFVVEQRCPYPELDGRDTDAGTRHLWAERDGVPVGYLRILSQHDGAARIGRVCVARSERGSGLARRLMLAALEGLDGRQCTLHAQAHLTGFYGSFGFVATGPEYLDDGIPHVPMARAAAA
jgi:ElaA protein